MLCDELLFFFVIFALLDKGNICDAIFMISFILDFVMIVCAILLLVAATKNEKPKFLLPWLVIELFWLIFVIFTYVLIGIFMNFDGVTAASDTGADAGATAVSTDAIIFFVFAIVYGGRLYQLA